MVERTFGGHHVRTAEPSAVAKERILLVDPDDDSRTMYREWLQQAGCEVVEAIDGREALAEALIRPPALVISEIRLPFIDGLALCEILRRDQSTARIPILMVTSDGRTAELARARAAGASAVLVKPATLEQMLEESRRLLATTAPPPEGESTAAPETAPPPRSGRRMSKSLARIATTTPPLPPPRAVCPSCDRLLTYRHSHIGGVNERQPEQWDWFLCPGPCGMYEYRHRTRSLRPL
jgi:two-component system chemotaxis response regulator CheY